MQKKHCLWSCIYAKKAYRAYFGMPVADQDKPWAPHIICVYCRRTSEGWSRGEKRVVRFSIPVSGVSSQTILQTVTTVW